MNVTAAFEPWVIGDGSYPALSFGMPVNLSFEMAVRSLEISRGQEALTSIGDAEYAFTATVLARYDDEEPIAALQANGLRFFVEGARVENAVVGERFRGRGSLVVDYYAWVEYIGERCESPDLFYSLIIRRIRRVRIPEVLIHRQETGKSFPARVTPAQFGEVVEIQTMIGQSLDEEFYLLDLEEIEDEVNRTFLG